MKKVVYASPDHFDRLPPVLVCPHIICPALKKVLAAILRLNLILALTLIPTLTLSLAHADPVIIDDDDPQLNQTTEYSEDGLAYQWNEDQYRPFYADFDG